MPMKQLAVAVAAAAFALTSQAVAADFYALSDNGRTVSLVDFVKGKVIRSVELAKTDQLTTIAYQPNSREVWGITTGKSLIRMKAKNLGIIFRSEPLGRDVKLDKPFLDWFMGQAYIVLSNKYAVSIEADGTLGLPFPLFKNPDGVGFPTLAAFTFITNTSFENSMIFGVDAESDQLLSASVVGTTEDPKWLQGPKLEKNVDAPVAFETIREGDADKGFIVLDKTLFSVNLKNGAFAKPRVIKGLAGDVSAITFVTILADSRTSQ